MRNLQAPQSIIPEAANISGVREYGAADPPLRELQLVELGLLREFVRLCEAHGLRYYLAYGTLLGAVRHKGFIPWDDDVDVMMPRRDYARFSKLCTSELGPEFRWQSYSTDAHYPHLFGKLLKDETVLRQAPSGHLPFQQSVYIDVFPLDGGARRPWVVSLQRLTIRICKLRLGAGFNRKPLKRTLAQLTRLIPRRLAIAVFEAMTRALPAHRSVRLISAGGPYGYRRQSFPSHWFGQGAPQIFEGHTLIGPTAVDEYLTQLYGDYMTPPPAPSRVSHHEVTEVWLGPAPAETASQTVTSYERKGDHAPPAKRPEDQS